MSKVKVLLLAVAMAPFILIAQNLVGNGDAESNLEGWPETQVRIVTDNPHSGKNCFKTTGTHVVSTEIIPVDGTSSYKYTGWFKNADDKKTRLIFCLLPMTADKKRILSNQVNVISGTETVLAAPCEAQDTVIKIKDGSKWDIKNEPSHIAFNVDNSGEYKDLPNTNVSAAVISKVVQKEEAWEVILSKPCGMNFAADTNVRVHQDGGYMNCLVVALQSNEWKEVTAIINGTAKSGSGGTQFWPGTKYVQIVILALNGGNIYFDDLKLEEKK